MADAEGTGALGLADETIGEDAGHRRASLPCRRGESVGPYLVIDRVGTGASGCVYAAYDNRLGRKVALKILHERGGPSAQAERGRVLSEAQALARVSHPNVVTVHEAGEADGRHYIAMEFVEGTTLDVWLAASPRTLQDKIAVLLAAGAGLSAAHGSGLIHRDFKPTNVMIDADGRVRVMDFGLARARHPEASSDTSESRSDPDDALRTRGEGIAGTPAYMAPEQHLGLAPDPRSDQFSYCVAAYEALVGVRPFQGKSLPELVTAIVEGDLPEPPRGTCPGAIWRVLRRGLSPTPELRWPSMAALLEHLAPSTWSRNRPRIWMLGLASLASGVVGALAVASGGDAPCDDQRLEQVWNAQTRSELEQRFEDVPERRRKQAIETLDRYVESWRDARQLACAGDTALPAAETLLSYDCLSLRETEFTASIELLADDETLDFADVTKLAEELTPVERCRDSVYLRSGAPVGARPEIAASVRDIEAGLVRARVLGRAGDYERADAMAEELLQEALPLEHDPLSAEAHLVRARFAVHRAQLELGRSHAAEAFALALRAHADVTAARAGAMSIIALGFLRGDDALVDVWRSHTMALVDRIGRSELEIEVLNALGVVALERRQFHRAIPLLQRASALLEAQGEALSFTRAAVEANLATALHGAGRSAAAGEAYRRNVEVMSRLAGETHPETLNARFGLVTTHAAALKYRAALSEVRPTCDGFESRLGLRHPSTINCRALQASFEFRVGDLDQAARLADEILQLTSDPMLWRFRTQATVLRLQLDRLETHGDEVADGYEELLREVEETPSVDPDVLPWLYDVATRAWLSSGRLDRALQTASAELSLVEAAEPWSAADVGPTYVLLGRVHLARGELSAARTSLETALGILVLAHEQPPSRRSIAEARLAHAELALIEGSEPELDEGEIRRLLDQLALVGRAAHFDLEHFSKRFDVPFEPLP